MNVRKPLVAAALAAAAFLAACDKAAPPAPPPPPPKAAAPVPAAPTVNEQTKRLAAEVYIYAFPLVLTDVTRAVETARAPYNTFEHRRALLDASTATTAVNPNADFLYSQAWLDLSKEPVVLSLPDPRGHYYLVALLDAWTNVAGSFGPRTMGNEKVDLAIVGPRWKGTLPGGVSEVKSPTEIAWLFGRLRPKDRNDVATATKLQDQIKVTPLSQFGKRGGKAAPAGGAANVDTKTSPRDQVTAMEPATFYARVAALLPGNPPAKEDAPMVEKMKKLGIVAGQPFDMAKLDPLTVTSIDAGAAQARDQIVKAGQSGGSADIRNGWKIDRDLGRWGVDYGKRAVEAWRGLGINAPEDALFMQAIFDGGGHRLDGSTGQYVLHFAKGAAPPTDGFWSLSLYDMQQHFVANPHNRHNIGSGDNLRVNPDGSIDIYVQNASPGADQASNWLPAPKGPFNLILRVYWPKQELIDGRWNPPGIRKIG